MAKGMTPFDPGTLVTHEKFGRGTVVKDRPGTHRGYQTVFFANDGKRRPDGTRSGKVRRVPQDELKLR